MHITIYIEEKDIEEILSKKNYVFVYDEHKSGNMFCPINYSDCVINFILYK